MLLGGKKISHKVLRNASGMTMGRWATMVFDRLKTSVLLDCNRQGLSSHLGSRTCAGSLLGGREGRQWTMLPFRLPIQPSHICLHGLCPPLKRVFLPPPLHLTWPSTVSEQPESFSAGKLQLPIYFMRTELTQANNNMCTFLESGLHFIVIWEQL